MNIILRPCYNRPEFLHLSLESEIKASEQYPFETKTLFVVEHGAPQKVLDIIKDYPFPSMCIMRDQRLGLSKNILEGFKTAFDQTDNHVIYLEDDVILHKDYFKFVDKTIKVINNSFSIICTLGVVEKGDVSEIHKTNLYSPAGPVISKYFFNKYVRSHANNEFYNNPAGYVLMINNKYKKHSIYKYDSAAHNQQAGLINRLGDAAIIEEKLYMYRPQVSRAQHIGYVGYNRPGGTIPGKTYEERVDNLRKIILSADEMYKRSGTPQYKDYRTLMPSLDKWDGTLHEGNFRGKRRKI